MEDIHSQSTSLRTVRKHHLASVVLSDLFEGLYAVQLRAVSLAGASHWTVEGTFFVPDSKPGMSRNFLT
ncbi:Insulin growth factor 1 receptor, partial [Fasciolopsis buskii]